MSNSTCMSVVNSIFLPYLIAGICGWGVFFFREDTKNRKKIIGVLAVVLLMFFWRFARKDFSSARYGENLLVFFAFGVAFFLRYPDIFLNRIPVSHIKMMRIKRIVIAICLVCLTIKFFHYNPYQDYNEKVAACIQNDNPAMDSIIVTPRAQYHYLEEIPQYIVPDFLKKDMEEKDFLFYCIRQYQFMAEHLYFSWEKPLHSYYLPDHELKRITDLGSFQKNRKGKRIYLFRYDSDLLTLSLMKTSSPILPEANNILKNGDFEKQRPFPAENSYYERIAESPKTGTIPAGQSFPESWDIYWGLGYEYGTIASIYSTQQNAISGRYSLKVKSNKTVSVLYHASLAKKKYLFQCDMIPAASCSFGLQLSLRDQADTFYGFREIKRTRMDRANLLYHYEIELTEDMFAPFPKFYLYLVFYDQSEILIDNVSLTEISK